MNMLDRIKKLMKEQGITNLHQLAEVCDVPYTTIFSMFNRSYENTSISTLNKIKTALGCSLDYLVRDDFSEEEEKEFQEQKKLDERLAMLDARQQKIIKDIVKAQIGISDNLVVKPLKLFSQSACAGDGNFVDSDEYEVVEFINPPKTAEWAIKVQGNSMEPLISDGDILYVNPNAQINNNEIGLFYYQGVVYVKQLKHLNGRTILHPLNERFDDIEILYPDEFYIKGRIL